MVVNMFVQQSREHVDCRTKTMLLLQAEQNLIHSLLVHLPAIGTELTSVHSQFS